MEIKFRKILFIFFGIVFSTMGVTHLSWAANSEDDHKTNSNPPPAEKPAPANPTNNGDNSLKGIQTRDQLLNSVGVPPEESDAPGSLQELFKTIDYPELQVVPRASQRIKMEGAEELDNWWYIHWPFYISALSTLGLGSTASQYFREDLNDKEQSDAKSAAMVSQVVGASWFIGTLILVGRKPYFRAYKKLRGYSGNGRNNELLRERLSEEALEQTAYQMKVLSYVSVVTNFIAAGYTGVFLNDKGKVYAGVSALLSFLPIIFDDWYIYNYSKQMEYKRNIFTPVVSMQSQAKLGGGVDLYPTLGMVMEF